MQLHEKKFAKSFCSSVSGPDNNEKYNLCARAKNWVITAKIQSTS
jgi:hypothetical protein